MRRVCRWRLSSYILRASFRRSQTALWRGREEVSKNRQTIYSVRTCRARPVVVIRMISPMRTRSLPLPRPASPASVSLTAASLCENFGVTQKLSQTWACFTRCLGKSGKAAKANSCASDTRHALLYARVCIHHANGCVNELLGCFACSETGDVSQVARKMRSRIFQKLLQFH